MIEIYLKTNTNYDKNGDITLDPTSCTYKESEKELTLEHFLDEAKFIGYIHACCYGVAGLLAGG